MPAASGGSLSCIVVARFPKAIEVVMDRSGCDDSSLADECDDAGCDNERIIAELTLGGLSGESI